MTSRDHYAAIARTKPFSEASQFNLRKLAASAVLRRFKANESVANHDSWVHSLWFSTAGILRVTQYHPLGAQMTAQIAPSHAVIGCLDPFCARRHSLECFAVTDADVVFMPRAMLQHSLRADQRLALSLGALLNEQLWEEREIRLCCQLPAGPRLAAVLVYLYRKLGHRLPLTRRGIAEICGLTRETVIRTLSPLERMGAIRSGRGSLDILKPDLLQDRLRERN